MNRGAGRRAVFRNRKQRLLFLSLLGELAEIYRVEIHAYCLMPNHYHLLIHTPEAGLSRAMRQLDGVYTQRFNRLEATDGPLFRGRFKSILIDADAYLLQVSRYIHLNPVVAGIVERGYLYEWSSYRYYVSDHMTPSWLQKSFVLQQFGDREQVAFYRRFVESGKDEDVDRFYRATPLGPILGSNKFCRRIDELLVTPRRDREVPARAQVRPKPSIDVIVRMVSMVFGVLEEDLLNLARGRKSRGLARGAVAYLSRRVAGYGLSEIARCLRYDSYAGAASSLRRLESKMKHDPSLQAKVRQARELLNQNET
jgi:putative transposase